MTTNVQIPKNNYVGNGTKTSYAFTFDLGEEADLIVVVDDVVQVNYSDYTIQPDYEKGGYVDFTVAPASLADILIYRRTTLSQQIDYETYTEFPSDTHEWGFDKFMKILQELLQGVLDDGSGGTITFDLSTDQAQYLMTVLNSGGTDAPLPVWESSTLAGIYIGEYDLEANLPADESVTTKPDGYIWMGY